MSNLISFFAAAILIASPGFARAVEITEQQEYYNVSGQSLREVNERMFFRSPVVSQGEKYAASCHPDITWQFKYTAGSDWCMITAASLTARITYTMPRWAGYSDASPEMQEKWNLFYARLFTHEEGHGRLAIEEVRKAEQEVAGLKRRSCQELKEAISEKEAEFLKQLTKLNAEYDARTEHGNLQNAVLEAEAWPAKEE